MDMIGAFAHEWGYTHDGGIANDGHHGNLKMKAIIDTKKSPMATFGPRKMKETKNNPLWAMRLTIVKCQNMDQKAAKLTL